MAKLRITRLGHSGILYQSPGDKWLWVDRWSDSPNYAAPPEPWRVDVIAPTHGHFDHVGIEAADVVELAALGGTVVCSHEMSIYLASRGVEAIGMNKGGRFEAAGIGLNMVHADHTGGVTIASGGTQATREVGCWGWVIEFEDGTNVYHSGDTALFSDMALIKERWAPTIAVLPIGGHFTMGPEDAARAVALIGAKVVIPVHYATFPILAGSPAMLAVATTATVVSLGTGETWKA